MEEQNLKLNTGMREMMLPSQSYLITSLFAWSTTDLAFDCMYPCHRRHRRQKLLNPEIDKVKLLLTLPTLVRTKPASTLSTSYLYSMPKPHDLFVAKSRERLHIPNKRLYRGLSIQAYLRRSHIENKHMYLG